MTTTKVKQLQKELLEQKKQITGRLDQEEENVLEGELSTYDNHPADMGTELFERERDQAIEEHSRDELDKINAALQAIQDGTYGTCKECGKDIPFERLEVVPTALYCIDHTPEQDTHTERVPENRIPHPDDGEDSFRDAASYGTSETPSDFTEDNSSYDDLYRDEEEDETDIPDQSR